MCSSVQTLAGFVHGSDVVFFQAEDGIRDLVRSRGLGDVYKRQTILCTEVMEHVPNPEKTIEEFARILRPGGTIITTCLLYTSDAADERSSVDLGGRRIIKKKKKADTATHSGTNDYSSLPDKTQNTCSGVGARKSMAREQ